MQLRNVVLVDGLRSPFARGGRGKLVATRLDELGAQVLRALLDRNPRVHDRMIEDVGLGNVSGECIDARPGAINVGVFLDAAGSDTYLYPPEADPPPGNGASFGHQANGLASEYGVALDREGGETGIHAR